MNEIEKLQEKIEQLTSQLKEKDEQIEVLTAQSVDYTKQIEEFTNKVNELEETNNLKSRKISDLLLNSGSVIDNKKEEQVETTSDDDVQDLDEIIGGL